jgi:hypothetical protein
VIRNPEPEVLEVETSREAEEADRAPEPDLTADEVAELKRKAGLVVTEPIPPIPAPPVSPSTATAAEPGTIDFPADLYGHAEMTAFVEARFAAKAFAEAVARGRSVVVGEGDDEPED